MINRDNYLLKEIPKFHPLSRDYEQFWTGEIRKCIEGSWSGGYWLCGRLYFYCNFGTIELSDAYSSNRKLGRPRLRDIEWKIFNHWEEARGFSGFSKDPTYSCCRILTNPLVTDEELRARCFSYSGAFSKKKYDNFFKEDGTRKTYIPAREYLFLQFDRDMGKPLYNNEAKNFLMVGPRGYGKALAECTEIPLIDGSFKPIKDIKVGDRVIGDDGKPTTVLGHFPQGDRPMYRITFSDGRTIDCDEEHLWTLNKKNRKLVTITTKDIFSNYRYKHSKSGHTYIYKLPKVLPIEYNKKSLPIDPYILGALLGDGTLTSLSPKISTSDKELVDKFNSILEKDNLSLSPDNSNNNFNITRINRKGTKGNPLREKLIDLGLLVTCKEKFIPNEYLVSSIEDRFELLRGLLDTDGSINKDGSIEFSGINKKLVSQVAQLCRSLGIRCQLGESDRRGRVHTLPQGTQHETKHIEYRLYIRTDLDVFFLTRKLDRLQKSKNSYESSIVNVEKIETCKATCITVDNKSKLFLATRDYIPTHNSYIAGNIAAHEFLFDGVTDYDEYLQNIKDYKEGLTTDLPKVNVIVGAGDAKYSTSTLTKTWMTLEYLPGEQEIDGKLIPSPLARQTKGSIAPGKEVMHFYKKKIGGSWKNMGSKSVIKNRTFKDNPFAAQGERSSCMIWDEIGMFNNLRESYAATNDVQRIDSYKFGSSLFIGTGGDFVGEGTIDAKYMFYHPNEFDLLEFKDEWENTQTPISFYLSSEYADEQFKNEKGITTPELAKKGRDYYLEERKRLASSKGDSMSLDNFIVYHPLVPSDVFLSKLGNIFPVAEIQNRINIIRSVDAISYMGKPVQLIYDPTSKQGVSYRIDVEGKLSVINEFPYKGSNREGAVVIYEFPILDENNEVPPNLYIIGHDPYASDNPDGSSLASIYVLKTKRYATKHDHDQIVAQYVGRPFQGRKVVNEILMKLSMFYGNATIYFENSVGNVKEYFEKHKKLHLLCKVPQTVLAKKASFVTGAPMIYGYPMSNKAIKTEALAYLRDWLLEPRHMDDNGRIERNIDQIWDLPLLQELSQFNFDGNFDRVMGIAGAIVGLEETYNQYKESLIEDKNRGVDLKFLSENKNIFRSISPEVQYTHKIK